MGAGGTNVNVSLTLSGANRFIAQARKAAQAMGFMGGAAKKASGAYGVLGSKSAFIGGVGGTKGGGGGGGFFGKSGSRTAGGIARAFGAPAFMGGGFGTLAAGIAGFSAANAVGGQIREAVTGYADFESQMARVKVITGATDEQFKLLGNRAALLGRKTKYTSGEVADAFGFMAMAGMTTNEIMTASGDVLNLAAAGNMDVARAADIVTNIMRGYDIQAKDAGHATDVLTKAFTSSNVNLEMLGESFKYAGGLAKDSKWDFEEVAAAFGLMGNAGVQASMAGTSLRGLILRLNKLKKPSKEQGKIIKKFGLEFYDAQGRVKGLADILGELGKVEEDLRPDAFGWLFGNRVAQGLTALMREGKVGLDRLANTLRSVEAGYAEKVADARMKTLQGDFDRLRAASDELRKEFMRQGGANWLSTTLKEIKADIEDFQSAVSLNTWFDELINPEKALSHIASAFVRLGAGIVDAGLSLEATIVESLRGTWVGEGLGLGSDEDVDAKLAQIQGLRDKNTAEMVDWLIAFEDHRQKLVDDIRAARERYYQEYGRPRPEGERGGNLGIEGRKRREMQGREVVPTPADQAPMPGGANLPFGIMPGSNAHVPIPTQKIANEVENTAQAINSSIPQLQGALQGLANALSGATARLGAIAGSASGVAAQVNDGAQGAMMDGQ